MEFSGLSDPSWRSVSSTSNLYEILWPIRGLLEVRQLYATAETSGASYRQAQSHQILSD